MLSTDLPFKLSFFNDFGPRPSKVCTRCGFTNVTSPAAALCMCVCVVHGRAHGLRHDQQLEPAERLPGQAL